MSRRVGLMKAIGTAPVVKVLPPKAREARPSPDRGRLAREEVALPKQAARGLARPRRGTRVAVVVARWNAEITDRLAAGAVGAAHDAGARVDSFTVAGSFELPAAVATLAETGRYDAIVPIGCLIRGETPHMEILADAVALGLMELSVTYPIAIPFGVLTCETMEQAINRAGGKAGNKGFEAAMTAIEMVNLLKQLPER